MKELLTQVNRFFAEICGWLLSAIMILLIVDLVSRGVSMPIQGVSEIAVFVMVTVVYLGIAQTEKNRGHVRVTAVITRLPSRIRNIINFIVYALALGTIAVVVWAVTLNAIKAFNSKEAVAGTVPLLIWPVKFMIVVGCVLYFLQIVVNTIDEFKKLTSKEK